MIKLAVFGSKKYDIEFLTRFNQYSDFELTFLESKLSEETVDLATGFNAICIFVNDEVNANVIKRLAELGIKIIALRCAGFNNVDLKAAQAYGIQVCRVPEYSPEAVAEHAVGLMMTLSRKFHKAYARVKEDNFALDGLLGFNLHKKTVGIIGTGKIGVATLAILKGFGCRLLAFDPTPNPDAIALGTEYVELDNLFKQSDIISLHCPLLPQTKHIINDSSVEQMKSGAMLINTSRGGLVDTQAVIDGLKSKKIGFLGLDVYELEAELFFEDLSDQIIDDDLFQRLLTFPNVMITGHQGFFTEEALSTIAQTTLANIDAFFEGKTTGNEFFQD